MRDLSSEQFDLGLEGSCAIHVDRAGRPCSACGDFACPECGVQQSDAWRCSTCAERPTKKAQKRLRFCAGLLMVSGLLQAVSGLMMAAVVAIAAIRFAQGVPVETLNEAFADSGGVVVMSFQTAGFLCVGGLHIFSALMCRKGRRWALIVAALAVSIPIGMLVGGLCTFVTFAGAAIPLVMLSQNDAQKIFALNAAQESPEA